MAPHPLRALPRVPSLFAPSHVALSHICYHWIVAVTPIPMLMMLPEQGLFFPLSPTQWLVFCSVTNYSPWLPAPAMVG